jgi:hypothetical protein
VRKNRAGARIEVSRKNVCGAIQFDNIARGMLWNGRMRGNYGKKRFRRSALVVRCALNTIFQIPPSGIKCPGPEFVKQFGIVLNFPRGAASRAKWIMQPGSPTMLLT